MMVVSLAVLLLLTCGPWGSEATSVQHTVQKRETVCYGNLGCFNNDPPFRSLYRPISFLPQSPDVVKPKFNLRTRTTPPKGVLLRAGDPNAPGMAHFQHSRPTKFVVHGFIDSIHLGNWMQDMASQFLAQGDYNVVLVEWLFGSFDLYGQATANTRVVGAMIAELIDYLQNTTGARPEDMHIVGHSLGAHIAGYAGERLRYLGRITGLDPAEPYFQNMDIVVRLDPSDALFVDIMHTDGAAFYSVKTGLGMSQACGHVDYYVNGGHDQPGCAKSPVYHILENGLIEGVREAVACSHLRSYHLFTESINSACPFESFRCDSEEEFYKGNCIPCEGDGCGFMGMLADRVQPESRTPVKYYLKTGDRAPFCRYHYKVSLTFGTIQYDHQERGKLYVKINGSRDTTVDMELNEDYEYIKQGNTYTYIVTSSADLGQVHDVTFHWEHNSHILDPGSWNPLGLRHPTLYLDRVKVTSRQKSSAVTFCANGVRVETGDELKITTVC